MAGRPSEKRALALLRQAADLGINFFDTADVYGLGESDIGYAEQLLQKAFRGRSDIYIATKGGMWRKGVKWTYRGSTRDLRSACHASLRRLKTEAIFLYQLHAIHPASDLRAKVETLAKLRETGKITHLGLSNVTLSQLKKASQIAKVSTVQNSLNLYAIRDFESGLIRFCEQNSITYIAHSPLGGPFRRAIAQESLSLRLKAKYEKSAESILINWLWGLSPSVVVIPGFSKLATLKDALTASQLKLDRSDQKSLLALARFRMGNFTIE